MSIPKWRETLKRRLLARDSVCRGCGEPYGIPHMHEGIISRGKAMGLPKRKRIRIYDSINSTYVIIEGNIKCLPRRSAPPPEPPPIVPEAAVAPELPTGASTRTSVTDDARRRRAAGGSGTGTILTGSRGVSTGGSTALKSLLGQ